jgi:hypothetical protein
MLQANDGEAYPQLFLFNQIPKPAEETPLPASVPHPAPCDETGRLIELFEEVTGWVIEFSESNASQQRRKLAGMENEPAEGNFSIVDMSAQWPANKPTGHRGKCDEIVSIIDTLVGQLQSMRVEWNKMRSVVAAVAPENMEDEDIVLIDSFVPTTGNSRRTDADFEICESPVKSGVVDEFETEFEDAQDVSDSSGTLVRPPFEGWALGGATGIAGSMYLDWRVDAEEQICITVGKIESDFGIGDASTTINVDPLTCEYQVLGSKELIAFCVWDSKSMSLSPLQSQHQWRRLLPGQAIIATTSSKLAETELFGSRDEDRLEHPANQTSVDSLANADADQLAACFTRHVDVSDRVLVLKHK